MPRGTAIVAALALLAACKQESERAKPAPAARMPLPEIDARWIAPAAAARFVVIAADGGVRGGAWTGDPGAGVAIAAVDEDLARELSRAIHGDEDDEAPPPEEPEEEPGAAPTPEDLARRAENAWRTAHRDDRIFVLDGEVDVWDRGFGYGRSGGAPYEPDAAPEVDASLQHGAAGRLVRDPRPKSTLVLAEPTAPAARLITAVDVLSNLDEVFIGVAGPSGPAALALWFNSRGTNTGDDVVPVVALDAGGASVRRTDRKPTGIAIWTGGRIDAPALLAAYHAVTAEVEPRWHDAAMVTVDPTITVAQLLDVVTVLLGDGVTAIGLLDFAPPLSLVVVGDPEGKGDLDHAIVRRYVTRRRAKITACYAQVRIATPALAGVVTVRFRVETNGMTTGLRASSDQPALVACVEPFLRDLELPKPKGGAPYEVTTLPIVFRLPP